MQFKKSALFCICNALVVCLSFFFEFIKLLLLFFNLTVQALNIVIKFVIKLQASVTELVCNIAVCHCFCNLLALFRAHFGNIFARLYNVIIALLIFLQLTAEHCACCIFFVHCILRIFHNFCIKGPEVSCFHCVGHFSHKALTHTF